MISLGIALALLTAPARAAADSGSGSPLVVYNRPGDSTAVANLYDGNSYSTLVSHYARNGSLVREDRHSDGYQETARSMALDDSGGAYIAGIRYWQGGSYIWAMKYNPSGYQEWEWMDDQAGCVGAQIEISAGESWIAGNCSASGDRSLRLVRLTARGYLNWARSFDGAGRSQVQNLSVDFGHRASLTTESGERIFTIVVDGQGRQLTTY
ncbi:MAG: hypothetical protein ACHQ2Z_00085 [Elusimicrobiota bacterium]